MDCILIVDPDTQQRRCMALGLDLAGFEVQEAGSRERALEMLSVGRSDMMMVDLMLPGALGLQLAREARALLPDVDVVMTGGYSLSRGQLERAGLDPAAFVAKPFSMAELARFVEQRLRLRTPARHAACG